MCIHSFIHSFIINCFVLICAWNKGIYSLDGTSDTFTLTVGAIKSGTFTYSHVVVVLDWRVIL